MLTLAARNCPQIVVKKICLVLFCTSSGVNSCYYGSEDLDASLLIMPLAFFHRSNSNLA
jgi:hypothetical protein